MAKTKPWYRVVTPRADLLEGKPMDAAQFAVHLDKVRTGMAPKDYCEPERFFSRTYLTKTLTEISGEVLRRLSGEITETSAVFNMATQFGGGKTHALTLLYHLANGGPGASKWRDVPKILEKARIGTVPAKIAVATFVGTEFDSIKGRGGDDGTPLRKTPWGEIAFQLGGKEAFEHVRKHDDQFVEPKGDVIEAFLPKDRPCLILMDEIINYVSTYRSQGLHNKLYNFILSLSGVISGRNNAALVVSIPASELSYTDKDEADQQRFKNLLDRVGKAILMSSETETAEIIRRRLFDWDEQGIDENGKAILPAEAISVCREYSDWIVDHKNQIPQTFPIDHAREEFLANYPFHPSVLSVFEQKWQELPRFQRTRGVLRLLALWVSSSYAKGHRGAHKDTLIGLGSAPLEDPIFRAAVFEQLGEDRLEGAVTTDIAGKDNSHAVRLDNEAEETLKSAQVHKKTATVVFFESNGGQSRNMATEPEIRLAVAGPDIDSGNIENALSSLIDTCYYMNIERKQYRFGLKENLNKRFADRRASVKDEDVTGLIKEEIQKLFPATDGIERIFFPEKSAQIPDRPVVTFVITSPELSITEDTAVLGKIEKMTMEYGTSARTYKSALLWIVPESSAGLRDNSRKLLAWADIQAEGLTLDEAQERQLRTNIEKAKRDLRENIWRTYKNVVLLGKTGSIDQIDLGLVTSSSSSEPNNICKFIIQYLRGKDQIAKDYMARQLVKNWASAFIEWSTQSVRDAFYASPLFPRLLNSDSLKDTIARGVAEGQIAYVSKGDKGGYSTFKYKEQIDPSSVEISDDMYIIKADEAEKQIKPPVLTKILVTPERLFLQIGKKQTFIAQGVDQFNREMELPSVQWSATGGKIGSDGTFEPGKDEGNFIITAKSGKITGTANVTISKQEKGTTNEMPGDSKPRKIVWSGEVSPQKWMNLYTKVLTRFVKDGDLKLTVNIEASPKSGTTEQQMEETKAALRELGLSDDVKSG
jgi:hypothetical protein